VERKSDFAFDRDLCGQVRHRLKSFRYSGGNRDSRYNNGISPDENIGCFEHFRHARAKDRKIVFRAGT